MRKILTGLFAATFLFIAATGVSYSQSPSPYLTMDDMPDLVKCLPAPPDTLDPVFAHDVLRFYWGKEQRKNPERAAIAVRDAVWNLDALIDIFSEPFGYKISREDTPEIYKLMINAIATIEMIRVRPKAYYARKRPFERLSDTLLDERERPELSGEGSFPSGHTIRGWGAAMVLTEINPDAAEALFARACMYGESRVIDGAHWQSDVDISSNAAAIAYARLQTSPEYRKQVARAQSEFRHMR